MKFAKLNLAGFELEKDTPDCRPIVPDLSHWEKAAEWSLDSKSDTLATERIRIRNAMRNGTLCGKKLNGPYPALLIFLLDYLGWHPSCEALARAMPYIPKSFDLQSVLQVCDRLGFASEVAMLREEEIPLARLPALLVRPEPVILDMSENGKLIQTDTVIGVSKPFQSSGREQVVYFDIGERGEDKNTAWFASTVRELIKNSRWLILNTFLINLLMLLSATSVMFVFSVVLPSRSIETIATLVIGALLFLHYELVLRRARAREIGRLARQAEYFFATKILRKLTALPFEQLIAAPVSAQVARLKQYETVRGLFADRLLVTLLDLPFALIFFAAAFAALGVAVFVPFGLVLCCTLCAALLFSAAKRNDEALREAQLHYDEMFMDMVHKLKEIRNLQCEHLWLSRLDTAVLSLSRKRRAALNSRRIIQAFSIITTPLAIVATVLVGALAVASGNLTIGALVASMILITRSVAPIQQTLLALPRFAEIGRFSRQLDRFMSLPEENKITAKSSIIVRKPAAFALQRVQYVYPGTRRPALAGLTLEIREGEMLAVKGASGAGKSTLLLLLQGLLVPQGGVIALNGKSLRQIAPEEVRKSVVLVPQKPVFFHNSIAQNLRLGAPAATDHEIKAVLEELAVAEFVYKLPMGLETRLDEVQQDLLPRGVRQSLSLARALLRRPSGLLLDEPAEGLVQEQVDALFSAIHARSSECTVVLCSHRPSHIDKCHKILDLDTGKLIENRWAQSAEEVSQ